MQGAAVCDEIDTVIRSRVNRPMGTLGDAALSFTPSARG